MPLYKRIRDDVSKLSYVTRTRFTRAYLYIYYMKNEKEVYKRLPYRSDKYALIRVLKTVKKNADLKKQEIIKRKPLIIGSSIEKGEKNE